MKQIKEKDGRQLYIKLLNRYHQTMINGMLNTTEILIHIILKRKAKKIIVIVMTNKAKREG